MNLTNLWEQAIKRSLFNRSVDGAPGAMRRAVRPFGQPRSAPPRPCPVRQGARGCSSPFPHRASLWRRLRLRENAATLLRGTRAAALALAALAVLLALPLQAEAQTAITLVSNTGQGADADAAGTLDRAQAFTTGSNSGGYTLSSIDIISEDPQGDDASVSVCTVDGSGYPTTTCTALTAPSSFAAGTLTFTASPVMTLTSTTTYTVLIGIPGGGTLILDSTTSDGEDTGTAAGWSLTDSYDFKTSSNVWETISNGQSFRIAIKGTVGTTTTTQAVWSATFTPADLGSGILGCSNGVAAARCSNTTVLSEDSFNYDSTDYNITSLLTRSGGDLEIIVDPDLTTNTLADLTLVVGSTSLVLSGGTFNGDVKVVFNSPGITLTPGTAINVKLTTGTTTTVTNTAPRVANPIADRTATVGTALNFTFPTNTFADTDAGDTLTYTATQSDDSALPSWLTFTAATRTFSGTPATADVGTVSVKVTASDGTDSVSDTFDIVVSADTTTTQRPTVPAQTAVLVSNVGQSGADGFGLDVSELAQSFTTGDNATGYTLTNIELTLQTASSTATPTVKLYRGSADGTEVSTLTGPAMLDTNTIKNYAFTPSPTVPLGTSTTYWVVAKSDADTYWVSTTSYNEDETPAMGWEIGDAYESRVAGSTDSFTTSAGSVFQLRVNGTTRSGDGGGGNGGDGGGGNGGGGGGGGGGSRGGGGGGGTTGSARDDHGNTPAQATLVTLDPTRTASVPGRLNTAADVDYFSVDVPHAGVLVVETSGPTATVGTVWQAGAELATADSGGVRRNFRLSVRVAPGSVVIAVAGNGRQTGRYTLQVTFLPGYLENPGAESFQSGIGVISGWTCDADEVEITLNGEPQEAAYGTARLDTAGVCGDSDNGFGLLFNWNLLGDGEHEVVALVDGVELDRATATVTTLGAEFLSDATGTCTAADFPTMDETVTLAWQQTQQSFVLVDGPAPAGPTNRMGTPGMGYLENPEPNSFQSGIGVLSGWVCEGTEVIIELNGAPQPAAYGTERLDTLEMCGDTANGFGLLFNWNLLGEGEHEVVAFVDGEELGRATVRVTTLGAEFLLDVEGECTVEDFPMLGETVTLEWQQNSQNFVITDVE